MERVLLLNPPSGKEIILRDYGCSETSKADYNWPPIDLLAMSGMLKEHYDVHVLDSVALGQSSADALSHIQRLKPDHIFSLTGAVSLKSDMEFLGKAKQESGCRIYATGDVPIFESVDFMKAFGFVDAAILDFTSPDISRLPEGGKLQDIISRKGKGLVIGERSKRALFSYPMPMHEKFPLAKYSLPFSRRRPMTSVLTNIFGCPYKCTFCSSNKLAFKYRDMKNVLAELEYVDSLGVKEVYFRDFTFTVNENRVREICNGLIAKKPDFVWWCEGRFDNVNEELIKLMAKAGCYLIFFGVESGVQSVLDKTNKGISLTDVEEKLKLCSKYGIETLCSYVLGLPWDTEETINRTIAFAANSGCDYASFNTYVPRYGSALREIIGGGKFDVAEAEKLDSSNAGLSAGLDAEKLAVLRKKAMRSFYMRPGYMLRRLSRLRNRYQLQTLIRNGLSVIKGAV